MSIVMLQKLALEDQGGAQARRAGGRPAAPLTAAARHPQATPLSTPSHDTSDSPWSSPRRAGDPLTPARRHQGRSSVASAAPMGFAHP